MFEKEFVELKDAIKNAKEKNLNEVDLTDVFVSELLEMGYTKEWPNDDNSKIVIDKTGIIVLYNMLFDDYYSKYVCSHVPDDAPSFKKLTTLIFREGIMTQIIRLSEAYDYASVIRFNEIPN